MKAKKTKSGKWTVCAYYIDADGNVRRPRFTHEDKATVLRMALECQIEHRDDHARGKNGNMISFLSAANRYIEHRSKVLSPPTITGYKAILRNNFKLIKDKQVLDITADDVQEVVNICAAKNSPKTVRNVHGFLIAVVRSVRPDFSATTTLPQRVKPNLYTPTDADIQRLYTAVKNTRMEIPVILAATGGLRRSEICALTIDDIGESAITVNKAMVLTPDKKWQIKTTKTEAGTRTAFVPKEVTDRIHDLVQSGPITQMNPTMISEAFPHILKNLGLPKFRFHALRSYYASVLHALGVPDQYIMQYGGWHDVQTLQSHYQKALPDKVPEMAAIGMDHFSGVLTDKK